MDEDDLDDRSRGHDCTPFDESGPDRTGIEEHTIEPGGSSGADAHPIASRRA
jgi:hypothetical protein